MAKQHKTHRIDSLVSGLTAIDMPFVTGVVVLASAIVVPAVTVTKHQQAKRELIGVWQLADRLSYSGADLKRLSGRFDYGAIDWDLTRPGKGQSIAPSLDAIQLVHARLKTISEEQSIHGK
ncbi:hypothetical protein [Lacticaseibacillus sp. GG6-2]